MNRFLSFDDAWRKPVIALVMAAAAVTAYAAGGLAKCKDCQFKTDTVVHAAGVPGHVGKQISQLKFDGDALSERSATPVASIVKSLNSRKASAPKAVVYVTADQKLRGEAATAQANARAQALAKALEDAGLPKQRFETKAVAR